MKYYATIKRERATDTCNSTVQSQKNYAKWKKPDKRLHPVESCLCDILEKAKLEGKKWNLWLMGAKDEEKGIDHQKTPGNWNTGSQVKDREQSR